MKLHHPLSYLYPQTRKVLTDHNGELELTLINGSLVLDSANSNYSFGSLQRILKYGLQQIPMQEIQSVLLLGLGGGSVIATLRKDFQFKNQITAVEFDKKVIAIARDEFGITTDAQTTIIYEEASRFLLNNNQQFSLIIIDLFIGDEVPEQFYKNPFWNEVIRHTEKNGTILFNAAMKPVSVLGEVTAFLEDFKVTLYERVAGSNTLLIAHRNVF